MRCAELEQELVLLAGTGERASDALEEHLRTCAACRKRGDRIAKAWALLKEVPGLAERPGFAEEVRRRIARRRWRAALSIGGAAAAALLAIFIARGNGSGDPENPLSSLSSEDQEVVRHLEILEELELLGALEVMEEEEEGS